MGVVVSVGIKKLQKGKKVINRTKSCKIHDTKMSAYTPVPFPSPAVSKANKRILRANGH